MTMKEMTCDVCGGPEPLGVASTIMPYSCAFCRTCLEKGAQPVIVFECFWDDVKADFSKLMPGLAEELLAFVDGKYISYKDWAIAKKEREDGEGKT